MPTATSPVDASLEARAVTRYFGDFTALRNVNLVLKRGEAVLLYGPNGAGKTTLLRTLSGMAQPSDVRRNPARFKTSVGVVAHATFLYAELTARENLRLAGRLFGLADLDAKMEAALNLFNLQTRADTLVRALSRGWQQRVTLARAFLHQPGFLLLDEPFTGLDHSSSEHLMEILRRLPAEGRSVLFSTHNFEQGLAIAQRLIALESGQVRYDGPVDQAPDSVIRLLQAP
jgi:heme exporter protein A